MATAAQIINFDQTTDTGFRMWASTISSKFSALGLVQTSDKGQANWTSTTRGTDGAITSGQYTLTSASAPFSPGDVGKSITVNGAGPSGGNLTTTINTYVSATQVTLYSSANTTVSGATFSTISARATAAGANYEMWGLNDTLQSTYPVYLKIEYLNQYSVNYWGIAATVGFATDGYGNLTGNTSGRAYSPNSFINQALQAQCYFSGAANRVAMALATTNAGGITTAGHFLSLERTKDTSGNDTDTGAILLLVGTSGSYSATWSHPSFLYSQSAMFIYTPASGNVPSAERWLPCILSSATTGSSAYGTSVGAALPIPIAGGPQNPGINQMVCLAADFTPFATYTLSAYGTDHTYLHVGPYFVYNGLWALSNPVMATRLLMRYE